VNSETKEFNKKLQKIATLYNHVSLLETNLKRECFTKHGLRWNFLGKTMVLELILLQINKLVRKGFQTPINLIWKDNALVGNSGSNTEKLSTLLDNVNVSANSENIEKN
jgi:hypothetical protein